jgi:hypothetical protein
MSSLYNSGDNTTSIDLNDITIDGVNPAIDSVLGINTSNQLTIDITTDGLTEGFGNLYFSNARARSAISATGPVTYNSSSGLIDSTAIPTSLQDSYEGGPNILLGPASVTIQQGNINPNLLVVKDSGGTAQIILSSSGIYGLLLTGNQYLITDTSSVLNVSSRVNSEYFTDPTLSNFVRARATSLDLHSDSTRSMKLDSVITMEKDVIATADVFAQADLRSNGDFYVNPSYNGLLSATAGYVTAVSYDLQDAYDQGTTINTGGGQLTITGNQTVTGTLVNGGATGYSYQTSGTFGVITSIPAADISGFEAEARLAISATGAIDYDNVTGVISASGLSTIYNADGTLTGNRIVDLSTYNLTLRKSGTATFTDDFVIEDSTGTEYATMALVGGGGVTIRFCDATSQEGFINYAHSTDQMTFGCADSTRMALAPDSFDLSTTSGSTAHIDNDGNVILGLLAGPSVGTGQNNVIIGKDSDVSAINTGSAVAIGQNCFSASTGISLGYFAGNTGDTGLRNIFIGREAGFLNATSGADNTCIGGIDAGLRLTSGLRNVFIGSDAGASCTTGGYNTCVGMYAGNAITTGTTNTVIGYEADTSATATNSLALGYNTVAGGSNEYRYGNNFVTNHIFSSGQLQVKDGGGSATVLLEANQDVSQGSGRMVIQEQPGYGMGIAYCGDTNAYQGLGNNEWGVLRYNNSITASGIPIRGERTSDDIWLAGQTTINYQGSTTPAIRLNRFGDVEGDQGGEILVDGSSNMVIESPTGDVRIIPESSHVVSLENRAWIDSNGEAIRLNGSDHCYIGMYANGTTRDFYIGKASSSATEIRLQASNSKALSLASADGVKILNSLSIIDGNSTTPGISFSSDLDTGMYRITTNNIGFTCGGYNAVDFNAGRFLVRGNTASASNNIFLQRSNHGGTDLDAFLIKGNGDVLSKSGSYGTISDERRKTNMVTANSQWADTKAISTMMINYNLDGGEETLLGWGAQTLQQSFPKLVIRDEDDLYSVKQSIIFLKAVKCLGEAQERIETLEGQLTSVLDRLTALETA